MRVLSPTGRSTDNTETKLCAGISAGVATDLRRNDISLDGKAIALGGSRCVKIGLNSVGTVRGVAVPTLSRGMILRASVGRVA